MKFIFSVIVGVSIAFLIDYLWKRRKQASKTDIKTNELNVPKEQNETDSRLNCKPRVSIPRKVGKFALLYFAVVLSTSLLSGALGGLTQAYAVRVYTIAKLAAPAFVYLVFLYFLSQKYSLVNSAKLLAYVYAIMIILRVLFLVSSGTEMGEAFFYSVLPYICLLVFSGAVFLVKRPRATNDSVRQG